MNKPFWALLFLLSSTYSTALAGDPTSESRGWGGVTTAPSENECRSFIEAALKEQRSQVEPGVEENELGETIPTFEGEQINAVDQVVQETTVETYVEDVSKEPSETSAEEPIVGAEDAHISASIEQIDETTASAEVQGEESPEQAPTVAEEEQTPLESSEGQIEASGEVVNEEMNREIASTEEESVGEQSVEAEIGVNSESLNGVPVENSVEENVSAEQLGDTEAITAEQIDLISEEQSEMSAEQEQQISLEVEEANVGSSKNKNVELVNQENIEVKVQELVESLELEIASTEQPETVDHQSAEELSAEVLVDKVDQVVDEQLSEETSGERSNNEVTDEIITETVSAEETAEVPMERLVEDFSSELITDEISVEQGTDEIPIELASEEVSSEKRTEELPVEQVSAEVVEENVSEEISAQQVIEEASVTQSSVEEASKEILSEDVVVSSETEEVTKKSIDALEEAAEASTEQGAEKLPDSTEESTVEEPLLTQPEGQMPSEVTFTTPAKGSEQESATEPQNEIVSEEKAEVVATEARNEIPEQEDLTLNIEIPENLRPRNHISEVLRLDSESVDTEAKLLRAEEVTLKELKRLYEAAIKPLEILYKYRDLSNRHFGDAEIFSKPLILFMGPWSGGKSSIINYLLDNEFKTTALRTGAEPSPAYFNIVMWGEREEIMDGTQLAADWTFSGLQKFGQGLLDRLRGLKMNVPLLEKVNIVEIPGILEIRKQVERLFPLNDACQWFIDRADIIFLVYDPAKLDVGPETEAILDQLKGREYQTKIILNKADQVKPEELMRVQGTLIWNISPLMSSTEPPVMYSTSLWSHPYVAGSPSRLLFAQEKAFLKDLRDAVDKRVENKIASARRFAVRVRNHAKMVDCYLTTYYNHKTFFGNKERVSEDIIEHPQNYHIYEGLSTLTNISRYDLPDPDVYKDFFRLNPVYDFQQLASTCTYFRGCPINRLDVAIAYDLPELVGRYKKIAEEITKGQHSPKGRK